MAEWIAAVSVAELFGLFVEAECIEQRAEDEAAGAVVDFALLGGRAARAASGELLI